MDGTALVNQTRESVRKILREIEASQGAAAALAERWNKLGGVMAVAGVDWEAVGITEAQFTNAISSLGTLFPDLLGNHGTNLYTIVQ